MKKSVLLAILGSFICGNSFAGAPKLLGQWDDWAAYFYEDSAGRVCYMASTPKKDEGKYTKRGDIYAVVTHRPKEKSFDVFNINAGYKYKPESKVIVKIGNKTFDKLFTNEDKAWTVSDNVDKELIAEMKRGSRMIVHGTSAKGTTTKDTYSLARFSSAYKAISNKCKR